MGNLSRPSRDRDIRVALRAKLASAHGKDANAFVVEELPISRGGARIDMAVINGRIQGFEIKSSLDTLDRLETQARYYGAALELVTLVTAPDHLGEAMCIVPGWWAVVTAEVGSRGGVRFRRMRPGRANPDLTAVGCVGMLERDELVSLLARHDLDRGVRTSTRNVLVRLAAELLPLPKLVAGVRDLLKERTANEASLLGTAFGRSALGGGVAAARDLFAHGIEA
jgi:hypothetical protein